MKPCDVEDTDTVNYGLCGKSRVIVEETSDSLVESYWKAIHTISYFTGDQTNLYDDLLELIEDPSMSFVEFVKWLGKDENISND